MKKIQFIFLTVILTSCLGRQVFKNERNSCKLSLNNDSNYFFRYPVFLGSDSKEKGTYKIINNTLILRRIIPNRLDSIIECSEGYLTESPDSVTLSFKDLNDKNISVGVSINQISTIFKTDSLGNLRLSYQDLYTQRIDSLNIYFDNKIYKIRHGFYKPTNLWIILNQYVGKKSVILYREYYINKDTIIVDDLDPKASRRNILLIKQ